MTRKELHDMLAYAEVERRIFKNAHDDALRKCKSYNEWREATDVRALSESLGRWETIVKCLEIELRVTA